MNQIGKKTANQLMSPNFYGKLSLKNQLFVNF